MEGRGLRAGPHLAVRRVPSGSTCTQGSFLVDLGYYVVLGIKPRSAMYKVSSSCLTPAPQITSFQLNFVYVLLNKLRCLTIFQPLLVCLCDLRLGKAKKQCRVISVVSGQDCGWSAQEQTCLTQTLLVPSAWDPSSLQTRQSCSGERILQGPLRKP